MKKTAKVITLLFLFVVGIVSLSSTLLKITSNAAPPAVTISPVVPADVSAEANTASGNPIAFFDDYSWRVFIAMVWPAKAGQRGVADAALGLDIPNTPRVFETFKSDWEVFKPDGSAPSAWNDFSGAVPCGTDPIGFNDMVLASFSKFGNLGEAGFGDLVGPLIAQNKTYVRYLTGFNEVEFQQVMDKQLYLRSNLTNVTLPNGSIDVKSAWIDMASVAHPERYYTRMAWVLDPADGSCTKKLVGLVGLHIVQKTPSRPQWIWTTFEQVDNVPQSGASAPFAFNDGTGNPMPAGNPVPFPPPALAPAPFNVTRVLPVHSSTATTNTQYQQELKNRGSVWQFYQLVATQWPVPGNAPANPGDQDHTFPGRGATTAFANTTMETFDQKRITTGCMNCHTVTKDNTDFLWSLQVNAFPTPTPSLAMKFAALRLGLHGAKAMESKQKRLSKPLQQLKTLMQSAKR